jgi:galactokinase
MEVTARVPGRVNLIGDHTDYTDGLCFPMAIDRALTVRGIRQDDRREVHLVSSVAKVPAVVALDEQDPGSVEPEWARYVAAVVAAVRPPFGFDGEVTSTIPAGTGLSSSAALELAVALALGVPAGTPAERLDLARMCQAAEHLARGVPTGLLDQLACINGVAGHGMLIDCRALTVKPVPLPPDKAASWMVVNAGSRSLASGYKQRVAELAAAAAVIGPIRDASLADAEALRDPTLRDRVRHVITENARVTEFARVIARGDLAAAGALMNESHRSLRADFESSVPAVDELCERLMRRRGVYGVRITGAGWGGCAVALMRPGAVSPEEFHAAWLVRPSAGASVASTG